MRVLCYGAGAIGTLVGGYLARAGNPVALLGRPGHVDAVNRQGLEMRLPGAPPERVGLQAYSSLVQALGDGFAPELAILTVKGYDTPAAVADLQAHLPAGTLVLTLQNGIGNEELLAGALGLDRTLSGCITLSVGLPEPGCVELFSTKGGIGLASLDERTSIAPVASLLGQAGFTVMVQPDWRALKWSKLLLNVLGNAVAAILDLAPREVFADHALCGLERAAFNEALAVMKTWELRPVDLPGFPVRLLVFLFRSLPPTVLSPLLAGRLGSGRGEKMPSLWLDLRKGRTESEVAQLNGAVAAWGRKLGLATPANTRITDALTDILANPSRQEKYRHNPAALLKP
ncbi:MAG TPA: ketopantoate reductase family protein [Spirochaetia bacterium]|nr:ketopantoate reductase family protein [Spirochaetia bacterium]